MARWKLFGSKDQAADEKAQAKSSRTSSDVEVDVELNSQKPPKWSLGILNDRETDEVPGSVLLLSKVAKRNEPLGLQYAHARTSSSSLPSPYPPSIRSRTRSRTPTRPEKKKTADGKIILEPQPEESKNDPLNWAVWRRDAALLSLGFYCMVGGGITPLLAAGFNNVAHTYNVTVPRVALTTGLYMMGLGIGSVIMSPTAILFGKRPVYLSTAILFIAASVWCGASPDYPSLVVARIVQGIAVSPVECLPSATIAEIFFLHERAYRLGVYTLLLLGGKNLVPLVSAVIIQSLGWRWVFYIVAMIVGFGMALLFLFVPETYWDRTPRPSHTIRKQIHRLPHIFSRTHSKVGDGFPTLGNLDAAEKKRHHEDAHVAFNETEPEHQQREPVEDEPSTAPDALSKPGEPQNTQTEDISGKAQVREPPRAEMRPQLALAPVDTGEANANGFSEAPHLVFSGVSDDGSQDPAELCRYTDYYRGAPPKSFVETLKPYSGRLSQDKWLRVAVRPFILYTYPAVLWSAVIYSLSVGWLIVLSESVSDIYKNRKTYNFTALQTGLVYLSPFIGGVLGTAVAGKVSDLIVRFMSRRNDGVYEPEFRLVMALPVAVSTTIGLMGFGWSAYDHDNWIVPTIFFGVISFGCALGSTTAITFCVDSYRQYAGEALVTLNFSKNIFHGLVFSLFFTKWLESDGSKKVFIAVGAIQLAFCLLSIPMYIYGKRARMWTVRKNFMEKF